MSRGKTGVPGLRALNSEAGKPLDGTNRRISENRLTLRARQRLIRSAGGGDQRLELRHARAAVRSGVQRCADSLRRAQTVAAYRPQQALAPNTEAGTDDRAFRGGTGGHAAG